MTSTLRIDTKLSKDADEPSPQDARVPTTPTTRERVLSTTHGLLPHLRRGNSVKSPLAPSNSETLQGTLKARHESKKLLSTALERLQRRDMPPSGVHLGSSRVNSQRRLGAVMKSIASKGKPSEADAPVDSSVQRSKTFMDDSDEEEANSAVFYTDETCDHMFQLRDILKVSLLHGWDVFSPDDAQDGPARQGSSSTGKRWRRKRSTSQLMRGSRSRSRSASPTRDVQPQRVELFEDCLEVLSSVIEEDCRFQVRNPRPVRPANALQAVTLDVAQLLLYTRRYDPRSVAQVGFAVLPAFRVFKPHLYPRLIAFFDEGVIAWMLHDLAKLQGGDLAKNEESDPEEAHPIVAITVDEVLDDTPLQSERWQRWMKPGVGDSGVKTANAPHHDVAIYYLTSLVQPVLGTIFEHVEILAPNTVTTQRFTRFFDHLFQRKPDVYLDLLGVVAYDTPKARSVAISLLAAYWPKAVGHVVISKPITSPRPTSNSFVRPDVRSSIISANRMKHAQEHPYDHQFVPWQFRPSLNPALFEAFASNHCKVCSCAIEGFGLLCPFCMCAVHFDCYDYPQGSVLTEYSLQSDPEMRKVAIHRFCHVLSYRQDEPTHSIRKDQHEFRTVNIFNLSLCFVCHHPLWGNVSQGMKCGACDQFVHTACLAETISVDLGRCRFGLNDSSSVTISSSTLRRTCAEYYRDILLAEHELEAKSYEELSIFYAVLWTQLHILENGIALGSIHVDWEGNDEKNLNGFELHYVVKLLETYLASRPLQVSDVLQEYLDENKQSSSTSCFFFDWNTLAFVSSIAKLPNSSPSNMEGESSELLTVNQFAVAPGDHAQEMTHTYETVSLAHIRDRLGEAMHVFSDRAAKLLLSHMHHLGMLTRCDLGASLFLDGAAAYQAQCGFPVPFGFDVSVEVETVVCAIEACLKDIDLAVNEVGFLLLARRFWPNDMLSSYTFRRLAKTILRWILSEDTSLAVILRDYVARGRNLPGVRSGEPQAWPIEVQARPYTTPIASNGGEYVAGRRALLMRYAAPWMLALHDLDIEVYGKLLFQLACEHSEEAAYHDPYFLGANRMKTKHSNVMDTILKVLIRLSQASIVFSVFDDLFEAWLERVQDEETCQLQPMSSLPRLFTREDGSQRSSIVTDSRFTMVDLSAFSNVNPLQKLMSVAFASSEGFRTGLSWLCLFASSGVDIPLKTYLDFAVKGSRFHMDLQDCTMLVKAALYSCWLRSIGRHEMQAMIATLFTQMELQVVQNLQSREAVPQTTYFIRLSLGLCLLLYGCERQYLLSQKIILQEEISHLPSRRKAGARASAVSDPVIVDPRIMNTLASLLNQEMDGLSKLIVQFLYAFVSEASLVESYEADNFILRNSSTLSACAWESYAIQAPELSVIRASLLVRVLAVDAQAFQSLLAALFNDKSDWESRLQNALRLFRMILDIISPDFNVEDHQWRASVIEIFHYFFSLIWKDEREEIRVAADAWSQTLLPAHMAAIAQCWNEALGKAPIAERVKLVNFLLQLRTHFPKWKVLTWETVMETLRENDFLLKNGNDEDGMATAHLSFYGLPSVDIEESSSGSDPEHTLLRVTLVSLSLRMMADGIEVDVFSLLRLKEQALGVIGFQNVNVVPSATGHTFHVQFGNIRSISRWADPCLVDLMLILDSPQVFALSCAEMGGPFIEDDAPMPLLIGSPFVDVLLGIFKNAADLISLSPLTLKTLLQCHMIIVQKHDMESKPLKHLQGDLRESGRRILAMVTDHQHLSMELRQLALSAIQVFTKRWPNVIGTFIFEVVEELAKMLATIGYRQHHDDPLVIQGRLLLGDIMNTFYGRGILQTLFKKPLDDNFFEVLRWILESFSRTIAVGPWTGSLSDVLLHDTLSRLNNGDLNPVYVLFTNISKYCEIVHHTGFTATLFQFVGSSLTSIAQRIVDVTTDIVNFSPLVMLCATLIQHNKAQSRDFLPYVETLLRVVVTRAGVDAESVSRVLHIAGSLFRKIQPREQAFLSNHILVTFLQTVSEALCGKLRIAPSTLAASVQVCPPSPRSGMRRLTAIMSSIGPTCVPMERFVIFAEDGMQYLWNYSSTNPLHHDFNACQSIAQLVLQAALDRPQLIEILQQHPIDIRTWNLILLAAVRQNNSATRLLLGHFRSFTRIYNSSLNQDEVAISKAYIAVKLWIVLARQSGISEEENFNTTGDSVDVENITTMMIWSELWPPLEAVVTSLEQHGSSSNLMALTLGSIADLILFVHQSQTVISFERSSHFEILYRLRKTARLVPKINRVLNAMSEPPVEAPIQSRIAQIAAELEAEEKLAVAQWQENVRNVPEKGRRIVS
ncbi:hypothetical protein BC835DRAFT_1483812 [Cytidiella melzeri]|nr:hypothetical protein BC835DRAFT_1483812 [Cytidiella melzeri]